MYRSILLPLDGSVFAEHAMPVALEVARRAGAVLHPVRVYVPDEPWRRLESLTPYQFQGVPAYEKVYERETRRDERAYLDRIARTARSRGVTAVPELLDGPVAETLEQHAERVGADLVNMATHGRGPLDRAWIGSVADALVRRLPVPILLVRPTGGLRPDPTRPPTLEHLLIPLDGSALAEQTLEPATELGRLWGARHTLLMVVAPGALPSHAASGPAVRARDAAPAARYDDAHTYLGRLADRLRASGSRVDVRVIDEGDAASAILRVAEELDVDVIALATHGRGGLVRLMIGSVADSVVRGAAVPVLVYRPVKQPA